VGNVDREIDETDLLAGAQNHGTLDHVDQLADVAWPLVAGQHLEGIMGDAKNFSAAARPQVRNVVLG